MLLNYWDVILKLYTQKYNNFRIIIRYDIGKKKK